MTAIRPITRKFFARKFFTRKFLDLWVYLKKIFFRFCFGFKTHYLQKVIFADLTFIRPITRNWSGNDFYKTNHSKIRIFFYEFKPKIPDLGQIFQFLQKVIFADLTFIRPITPKFRGGNDFYKTNHSKIHEIRPITPKSDWSYNHPLL